MTEMNILQIQEIIPQRYPFIFVDRIIEIEPWKKAVGIKNLSMNEPFFQGHFPNAPIMPGVLMLEAIAQVVTILFKYKNTVTTLKKYEVILGSTKCRYLKPAQPGDQLIIDVSAVRFFSTGGMAKGVCRIQDSDICTAEISLIAKDISEF